MPTVQKALPFIVHCIVGKSVGRLICRRAVGIVKLGLVRREEEEQQKVAVRSSIHLDTQTGLAPVPPLSVVAVLDVSHAHSFQSFHRH